MRTEKARQWLRVIGATYVMTLRQNVMDGFILFTVLIQPLIIALLALWMVRSPTGEEVIYIVVGSGMTGLWSSLLFISGNTINFERWTGTLELLIGQPTPMPIIIFGKNLAQVTQSLGSMMVSFLLASWIFGYPLQIQKPGAFLLSLLLTIVAFVAFGLIIAPIFVLNPGIQGWQNAMEFPVYILSGFLFPIALLPRWTTPVSYLLAPYWAARALHGASEGGAPAGEMLFSWALLLAFAGLYVLLANSLFRRMIHKAKVEATLGSR